LKPFILDFRCAIFNPKSKIQNLKLSWSKLYFDSVTPNFLLIFVGDVLAYT
jgi:hypothetical protein